MVYNADMVAAWNRGPTLYLSQTQEKQQSSAEEPLDCISETYVHACSCHLASRCRHVPTLLLTYWLSMRLLAVDESGQRICDLPISSVSG